MAEGLPEHAAELETGIAETSLLPFVGSVDDRNRHASTVMLSASGEPAAEPLCSGVLIGPRLVLTAGSCVCTQRKPLTGDDPQKAFMDATACLRQVFVTTVLHGEERDPVLRRPRETAFRIYKGEVHPHPEFEILFGEQDSILSSRADLAAIHLEEAVDGALPPSPLATTEVQPGESLVMTGFARAERSSIAGEYGVRYWRKNPVTQVLAQGRVLYRQQGPYVSDGYAGGPCFREEGGEHRLVGISEAGAGEELSFTSTHLFRSWVSNERAHAVNKPAIRPTPVPKE
jgi:hypothetical protein